MQIRSKQMYARYSPGEAVFITGKKNGEPSKSLSTYSWFGTRLCWQIDGLDDLPGLFTSLCLIAFVTGLCLGVLKYYFTRKCSGLCCQDQVATVLQHVFSLPIFNIETCRMSLADNLSLYLLIGPRHNFVALSLSYSSFYFCFN